MPLIRKDSEPPNPSDAPGERDALTRGDAQARWAAARALAGRADGVAILADALAREEDPRVREAIFTSLARTASQESVAAMLPYLRSDEASLRTGAIDALRTMPGLVTPHIAALFADADPDVRLLACELARGLPGAEATSLLCALLDAEDQANVCAAAVEVLAEVGLPGALPALERCAARFPNEAFLGFSIRLAAERIGVDAPDRHG